ncbi:MAG: ArnT family glycosyltransferase, partial [Nitrospinales bacterium]
MVHSAFRCAVSRFIRTLLPKSRSPFRVLAIIHPTHLSVNPYPLRLTVFLTAATIFRLCFAASLELTPDEAYYWGWSRHLQGGYFDHPPMVAAWIALTTWVGGSSELFVRLAAVIPGLGLSLIAYFLGRDLFQSEKAGYYGALWLNLILIISLGSVIITPDTPL